MASADQPELRVRQEDQARAVETTLTLLGNPRERVEIAWADADGTVIGKLDIPAAIDGKPRIPQGRNFTTIGEWCVEEHPPLTIIEDNLTKAGAILIPQLQSLRETVMSAIGTAEAERVTLTIGGDHNDLRTRLVVTQDQISASTKREDPTVDPLESFVNARICQAGDAELSVIQRSLGSEEENVGEIIYFPIDTDLGRILVPSLEGVRGLGEARFVVESIFPGAFGTEKPQSTEPIAVAQRSTPLLTKLAAAREARGENPQS